MNTHLAGLVLLQSFLPSYFIKNKWLQTNLDTFKDVQCQIQAAACLRHMVNFNEVRPVENTVLVNLLCGLNSQFLVSNEVPLTSQQQEIIHDFLSTCQAYWPDMKKESLDIFKLSWLSREGDLTEHQEHWRLTVVKAVNDNLLKSAPFSFNFIQYPWMPKPIIVNWLAG